MIGAVLGAKPLPVQNPAMQALQIGQAGQSIQNSIMQREAEKKRMELAQQMQPYRQGLLSAQTNLANTHNRMAPQQWADTQAMNAAKMQALQHTNLERNIAAIHAHPEWFNQGAISSSSTPGGAPTSGGITQQQAEQMALRKAFGGGQPRTAAQERLSAAQAAKDEWQLKNPGSMFSGLAGAEAGADYYDSIGRPDMANKIRASLDAATQYKANRGDYYGKMSSNFVTRMYPTNARPFIMKYLTDNGLMGKDFSELTPDQQKDMSSIGESAQAYISMPAILKTAVGIAPSAHKNYNILVGQYNQLRDEGLQSGVPGWSQMKLSQLSSALGGNNPKSIQKYDNMIGQIYQTQMTLAKQYARIMGIRNTDQAAAVSEKVVGSINDLKTHSWTYQMGKMKNLYQLMKNEVGALSTGGGPQALGALSQFSQPGATATAVSPSASAVVSPPASVNSRSDYAKWLQSLTPVQRESLRSQRTGG